SWAWDFQGDGIVDSTLQNPQFTYTTPGSYTVSLTVSNAAGSNTTTKVSSITVTASPPTINSFTPTSGPVGTSVTISGSHFSGATAVTFNGTAATLSGVTDTQITTSVPSGASSGPISVSTSVGTATSTSNFTVTTPPTGNLLLNPGFELDANNDGKPDNWTISSTFTRSNAVVHSGSYAGKFFATDNSNRTVTQTFYNLTGGTMYTFSGWVNIPLTSNAFTFELEVKWFNANNLSLRPKSVNVYTASTSGWDQAMPSMVAPAGT